MKIKWLLIFLGGIYSAVFIYGSSFVGMDGQRYFSLFDDAMISMRYAWNFSHGQGLVWNAGERVEGFTNFSWVLYMSLLTGLFGQKMAVLLVQVTGLPILWLIGHQLGGIAKQIFAPPHRGLEALAMALPFLYYPLIFWSLMGMETGLLTLLSTAAVLRVLRVEDRGDWLYACLLGLMFWTRPDALVLLALVWLYRAANFGGQRRILLLEGGLVAGWCAALSLFRLVYYGQIFPNTYILKIEGFPLAERVWGNLEYTQVFLLSLPLILIFVGGYVVYKRDRRISFLAGLFAAQVAYQVYAGGDAWAYWRLTTPTTPFLLLIFVGGLQEVQRKWGWRGWVLAFACANLLIANGRFMPEYLLLAPVYQRADNQANLNQALALRAVSQPEASVGVFWAGTIPYYLPAHRAIDFLGKSDPHIARLSPYLDSADAYGLYVGSNPGHNKYDLAYSMLTLGPVYIQDYRFFRTDMRCQVPHRPFSYRGVTLLLNPESESIDWDLLRPLPSPEC